MQHASIRSFAGLAAIVLATGATIVSAPARTPDVHYVPTPQNVVDRMLELTAPKPGEYLIDLGSGDGRIPIAAAKRFGISGHGVDIDPVRITEAEANAKSAGVQDKVEFIQADLFETDISKADIVTLYLLQTLNAKLRPRLLNELRPGTRVVSHSFSMGDWTADRHETVGGRDVYFWIVPARVEGEWRLQNGSEAVVNLSLKQKYQVVTGTATMEGKPLPIEQVSLRGAELSFRIGGQTYQGKVDGNSIVPSGTGDWRAERI
ncbi:class I SAM-dependent methyltransferase [Rhodopseudomonas palustris]|uniref:SAM-dependent methyltransferase n=1 Tax=Rhodopseudomonas palustris TaxID=1076 RepID=UPI002ACE3A1F|nr:class I SAM-dependent methyltransferase [Rhodopseudomonas palustris]WQG98028.1 class I SAM-dependent methyltransferase [Rhodopseudomonas palustris]